MKRVFILTLLLMVMATGAFAMDMAFGVGGMFNTATTSGTMYEETDWTLQRRGFGGFAFLGFSRFFEMNFGFIYKTPSVYEEEPDIIEKGDDISYLESTSALLFGLYFKYPIPLSDSFVFFPTIGLDYEFTINKESENYITWWDDFMIRAGLGIDIFATEKFFIRAHALYGFGFPIGESEYDSYKNTHGLLVKIGIGWMF